MRPLDPRLLRHARAARWFLVASVLIGSTTALLLVGQAFLIGSVVAEAFQGRVSTDDLTGPVVGLVLITLARASLTWLGEAVGHRAAAGTTSQLRLAVLQHALRGGTATPGGQGPAALTTLVTRSATALDTYFARYLPQLVLAVLIPLIGGVAILTQDPLAAIIVALTVPLIPAFMVLIGRSTQARVDRQWATLGVLSGHFLDVVAGLPTLKVFNRAKAQARTIRDVGDRYRHSTMSVLRVSFLSSLVLELLASLSVAIIAVSIGLRLVDGRMALSTGLAVLILAPEVYLPLRLVGQHFHAAADGVGAAERMFEVLESESPPAGTATVDASRITVRVRDLAVAYGERIAVADASFDIPPGQVTAIVGPSGCGKSTVLSVLLGLVGPPNADVRGHVEVVDATGRATALGELDPAGWRAQVGWVPQTPSLLAGTVADNVRFGRSGFADEAVASALALAGLPVDSLERGSDTPVGDAGDGVSAGQARRIAVARALLAEPAILLFDEPTAALDTSREAEIGAVLTELARQGRTVVVVTHRSALVRSADHVVCLAPVVHVVART